MVEEASQGLGKEWEAECYGGRGGFRAPGLIPSGAGGWKGQRASLPARRGEPVRKAFGSRTGEDADCPAGGGWRAAQGRRLRSGDCLGCESWPSTPPETPPSSHLKPALGHSVHVPPHGASGCGPGRALRRAECKDRGQGRPGSSGSGRRRRL